MPLWSTKRPPYNTIDIADAAERMRKARASLRITVIHARHVSKQAVRFGDRLEAEFTKEQGAV